MKLSKLWPRKSDSDEQDEQEEILIHKPKAAEVRKAFKCLQDFCLCSQVEPGVLDSVESIEAHINNIVVSQAKQKKLTHFFCSSCIYLTST